MFLYDLAHMKKFSHQFFVEASSNIMLIKNKIMALALLWEICKSLHVYLNVQWKSTKSVNYKQKAIFHDCLTTAKDHSIRIPFMIQDPIYQVIWDYVAPVILLIHTFV